MDDMGRSWTRAVARFAVGGLAGALLLVFAMAPTAMAAPVSHFRINNAALTEGNAGTTNLTFAISYTGTPNTISVDWATASGTATSGADFTASSGTANFLAAGPMSQNITIPIAGDLLDEANETFTVNLTNAQPPATADITVATGIGTINDDDATPSLVINDVSMTEGNAGTSNATFGVSLSAPSGRNVTVNYTTAERHRRCSPTTTPRTAGTLTFTPAQIAADHHGPDRRRHAPTRTTRPTSSTSPARATRRSPTARASARSSTTTPRRRISINDVAHRGQRRHRRTPTFTVTPVRGQRPDRHGDLRHRRRHRRAPAATTPPPAAR